MKNSLIIFAIGLLLGFSFSIMWRTLSVDVPSMAVPKQSAAELKKQVAKSEVSYARSYDSLKQQSSKLTVELTETKTALSKAKQRSHSLQVQVYSLIDRQIENGDLNLQTDNPCDSLITTVDYLMQSSLEKDSLYEAVTANLEGQIKNKDSTVALKDESYNGLKSAFNKSIEGQEQLLEQNKFLNKQVKKQKFKSKILSAALFIFSGAAINHIIRH